MKQTPDEKGNIKVCGPDGARGFVFINATRWEGLGPDEQPDEWTEEMGFGTVEPKATPETHPEMVEARKERRGARAERLVAEVEGLEAALEGATDPTTKVMIQAKLLEVGAKSTAATAAAKAVGAV